MLSGRRWSSGLRSARIAAWSGSGGKCSDRYCRSGPLYLQRTRVESVAERKLRRRQLTEEGNVEIWRTALAKCQVGTGDRRESVSNRPTAVVRLRSQLPRPCPQRQTAVRACRFPDQGEHLRFGYLHRGVTSTARWPARPVDRGWFVGFYSAGIFTIAGRCFRIRVVAFAALHSGSRAVTSLSPYVGRCNHPL